MGAVAKKLAERPTFALLGLFASASRPLTVAVISLGVLQGLAGPSMIVATGVVVGTIRSGGSATGPLVFLVSLVLLQRLVAMLIEECTVVLTRRADELLDQRVMGAIGSSRGLEQVEDPYVRDRMIQAKGTLTGITPGQATGGLIRLWSQRLQGSLALVIVARFSWLAALGLSATLAVAFVVIRKHWHELSLVLYGRTDELRRSYYLRSLALSGDFAKESRVFGLSGWLAEQYRANWLGVMEKIWRQRDEAWLKMLGVTLLTALVEVTILIALVHSAVRGDTSLGVAVAVGQAVITAITLGNYTEDHWLLHEAYSALRIVEDIEAATSHTSSSGGEHREASRPTVSIRFEDVHFSYPGQQTPVFSGFSIEIEAGQSLAIVGSNGAGKTTFIKLLARLYDPDQGRITVDGVDLRELEIDSWRKQLAAVFQDYVQFDLSARDNIAFGAVDRTFSDTEISTVAALTGATRLISRLPRGLDTVLSREYSEGLQLSGGEWQRLALTRAMLAVDQGSSVLVLDEPTAAMDVRGEAEIYDRFLELTAGLTTIVVSHRFSTVRRAHRIVVIEHGRVVEDGDHARLMGLNGRYAHMYLLQASRFNDQPRSFPEHHDA